MQRQQQRGQFIGEVDSKIQSITDITLPMSAPRVINTDYKTVNFKRLSPMNSQTTFISGQDTITFDIIGEQSTLWDPSESYLEFSLDYKNVSSGSLLSGVDVTTNTNKKAYCGSNMTPAQFIAVPVVTNSITAYAYLNNPMMLFKDVKIMDWASQTSLITNESCGIWTAINKCNQDISFYDNSNEKDLNIAQRCLCNVHSFEPSPYIVDDTDKANYISPSMRIPGYLPTSDGNGIYFPEVYKQMLSIKKSQVAGGFRFRIPLPMITDLFNSQKISPMYNKLTLKLALNTYTQAVTDCKNTITGTDATHPGDTSALSSLFSQFIISNCFLVIKKFTLTESKTEELSQWYESGKLEIPFVKYFRDYINVAPSVTYLNHTINRSDIADLRMIICAIMPERDIGADDCKVSHAEFTMGNGFNHHIDSDYDGISKIEMQYNGRSDIIWADSEICDNIGPYSASMEFLKNQLRGAFASDIDNITARDFDGLDATTKLFDAYRNASFAICLDLRKLGYVEKSGINLSVSPLNISFTFKAHGTEALRIAMFLVCGAVLQTKPGSNQVVAGCN